MYSGKRSASGAGGPYDRSAARRCHGPCVWRHSDSSPTGRSARPTASGRGVRGSCAATRARPLSPIRTRQPARRPLTRPLLHPSIICAAPEFFLHESTAVPEPSPAPGDGANIAFARRTSTPGMCGMCISLSECSSLAPVPLRAIHAWSGLLQNSAGERSHERCISRTRGLRKLRPPLQPVERVVKSLARAH